MLVPVSLYLAYGERQILSSIFLKPSLIASFARFHTTKHLYIWAAHNFMLDEELELK